MHITEAIGLLSEAFQRPLPGKEAQYKMAPLSRLPKGVFVQPENARPSAVSIVVYPVADTAHILYIKRSSYDGVHSNQVAFPGGKYDAADATLIKTAQRELMEEVGVDAGRLNFAGRLSELYIPVSNFLVSPFLFTSAAPLRFYPHKHEVSEILEFPLRQLLQEEICGSTPVKLSNGVEMQTPYFDIMGHVLWGATAMISSELKEMIKGAGR